MSACLCLKLWRVFGISDSHVSKSLRHIQHSKFMSSLPLPLPLSLPLPLPLLLLLPLGVAPCGRWQTCFTFYIRRGLLLLQVPCGTLKRLKALANISANNLDKDSFWPGLNLLENGGGGRDWGTLDF